MLCCLLQSACCLLAHVTTAEPDWLSANRTSPSQPIAEPNIKANITGFIPAAMLNCCFEKFLKAIQI